MTIKSLREYQQRPRKFIRAIGEGAGWRGHGAPLCMHNDVEYGSLFIVILLLLTGFNEAEAVAVFTNHTEHQPILCVRHLKI